MNRLPKWACVTLAAMVTAAAARPRPSHRPAEPERLVPKRSAGGQAASFVHYQKHDPQAGLVTVVAFYFPQFHPFYENNKFWGAGFTDWANVVKAKPLFHGHYQPHRPIHMGYYDLRNPRTLRTQVQLATNYGVDAFAFHFYWFNGVVIMDTPVRHLLARSSIDIQFCLSWANEDWSRRWDGGVSSAKGDILLTQEYSVEDSLRFIRHLIPYFRDRRYMRVDGKPVLIVYHARQLPDASAVVRMWDAEMKLAGFKGIYTVAAQTFGMTDPSEVGFDAAVEFPPHHFASDKEGRLDLVPDLVPDFRGRLLDYDEIVRNRTHGLRSDNFTLFRTSMMGWDNTARKRRDATVFANFSLASFAHWNAANMKHAVGQGKQGHPRLTFINAWNEWAEGSHLEPDEMYGYGYLESVWRAKQQYLAPRQT